MLNNLLIDMMVNKALSNPSIRNNPTAMEYLNVIKSGDNKRGEEIANDLCKAHGETTDNAIQNAKRFFNL